LAVATNVLKSLRFAIVTDIRFAIASPTSSRRWSSQLTFFTYNRRATAMLTPAIDGKHAQSRLGFSVSFLDDRCRIEERK